MGGGHRFTQSWKIERHDLLAMFATRIQGRRSGRRQVPGFARMRDFVRQCGEAAASAVAPSWARWLLARAAIAPPMWKTPLFERVCAKLVRSSLRTTEDVVITNFGLRADLRCLIALNKTAYVFGKFEHMLSERATFALVRELAGDCDEFVDVGANEGAFTFLVHNNHRQAALVRTGSTTCAASRDKPDQQQKLSPAETRWRLLSAAGQPLSSRT
jgi:hypothetical protein